MMEQQKPPPPLWLLLLFVSMVKKKNTVPTRRWDSHYVCDMQQLNLLMCHYLFL
jgi:hypothetical protein